MNSRVEAESHVQSAQGGGELSAQQSESHSPEHSAPQHAPAVSVQRDLCASLVVFLVALPLCMGVAIASGAPVAAGLVTGIVGGIVVGLLAGSPLQVSGPAAGLTVIVLGIVQQGGMETLGLVVLLAGLIQIVAGMTGVGQWFRAVSPAVVEGMLAGIGILIFAGQFHVMVDDQPRKNGLLNLSTLPEAVQKGLPWPTLGTTEQRTVRRQWLRDLETLHAEQEQLKKQVSSLVHTPKRANGHGHSEEEDLLNPPSPPHVEPAALQPFVVRQRNQLARLEEHQQRAGQMDDTALDSDQRLQLQEQLAAAITTSKAALDDLEQNRTEQLRLSQFKAADSLLTLRNGFKSHDTAAKLGLLTIAIMFIWQWIPWKRLKVIPAPLLAVTVATVVSAWLVLPVVNVEIPESIVSDLRFPSSDLLAKADWHFVIQMAIVVALVASAETLLCCSAVDQMHQGVRTQYNRELVAQGIGNTICGAIGGLPMTGVIVRSAANVQAGATSRLSAILHGVWILIFVVLLSSLIRLIPTASLAAMLVYTGVRLINIKALRAFWKLDKFEAGIFIVTAAVVVVEGLLEGVVLGIVLAAARLLWQFSYLKVEVEPNAKDKPIVVRLKGAATFLRLPQLAAALENISPREKVHLDVDELTYIDHACLELIVHWHKRHLAAGGELELDMEELAARYRSRSADSAEALALHTH
jgi:MFS superfamily sulfate permease-like transporter